MDGGAVRRCGLLMAGGVMTAPFFILGEGY